ncbi:MAG: DUF2971 domain-containing protein [Saccharofermentanales bacterium]
MIETKFYESLIKNKIPKTLYHYTTNGSLFNILKNQTILFSDPRYFNDAEDGYFFLNEFMKYIKKLENEKSLDKSSYNYLAEILLLFYKQIYNDYKIYIWSLTSEKDSLPLWGLYGDLTRGCVIGFNMINYFDEISLIDGTKMGIPSIKIFPVVYCQDNDLNSIFDEIIDKVINRTKVKNIDEYIIKKLISYNFIFKSSDFMNEKEWRVVACFSSARLQELIDRKVIETACFQNIPALKFTYDLTKNIHKKDLGKNEYITEIILGYNYPKISEGLPHDFYIFHGIDVKKIRKSHIKYRL